jgi:transcriptional regulator with XRE-family HTH domain
MIRIVGTKIRKLREEMELTQEDLAKSVGLSSEFISLLELGRRSPSLESLSRIAKFLDKEISFFILEKEESFDSLIKGERIDSKTKRLLKKFRKHCNDYLELEELTGRQSDLAPLYTNITAEKMAAQERGRLGLGDDPIPDVFSLIEQNGLHVWRSPIPEEINIAGVFVFFEYKQTAFAMINSYQSSSQQILTATHEYGHYLKDRFDGPIIDNPDIFIEDYITLYHGREKYAQTFALHFLLPPEGLRDFIERDLRSKQLNLEDILYIRRYHDVSFLALLQMLKKLDYVSVSQFKQLQKLDWEQHEISLFGSGKMSVSQRIRGHALLSARYVSLVLDAFRIKKISAEKAGQLLRLNKEKFLSLLKR